MPLETLIGRALAIVAHPATAWRVLPLRGRAALLAAYVAAGYLIGLAAFLGL